MSYTVYRIYYGKNIVYVGRTKQPLQNRIHGHLFAKPMHRAINIDAVTKIEYHNFQTEADMNLYEIYYILKLHPKLNVDDKTRDYPTIDLPEVEFVEANFNRWNIWKEQLHRSAKTELYRRHRRDEIRVELSGLRVAHIQGKIDEDEYWDRKEILEAELKKL